MMFAHAMEAAKRANNKISSRTVVGLVIHVVQQLRVDELCVRKNRWPSLV